MFCRYAHYKMLWRAFGDEATTVQSFHHCTHYSTSNEASIVFCFNLKIQKNATYFGREHIELRSKTVFSLTIKYFTNWSLLHQNRSKTTLVSTPPSFPIASHLFSSVSRPKDVHHTQKRSTTIRFRLNDHSRFVHECVCVETFSPIIWYSEFFFVIFYKYFLVFVPVCVCA